MMQHRLLVATTILIMAQTTTSGKTIVLFPFPTASYVIYHGNVASALAGLGHDAWVCLPHCLLQRKLIQDNSVKILEYGEHLGDLTARIYENTQIVDRFWAGIESSAREFVFNYSAVYEKICVEILSDQKFVQNLKNLNADLFVLDSMIFNLNLIVLPYKLDIPYALIGPMHDVILARVPFSPAATPFLTKGITSDLTFLQRLQSTLFCVITMSFELFYNSDFVSRFAPEKPCVSISDLAAKAEIFIAELDHILDYPRPTLPNTKLIGGSSASPAKPLVGEFKKFVDDAKNGIVVASFGGSVVNVPPYITDKLISAYKQLDLRVVWRVNITSPDPNQIMTSKWIPQNDLLGHAKTKLFVSHCGKNGQYEALYHGVPILCLPIYGDQFYNADRVTVKGYGLQADMRTASADDLAYLMKKILNDRKYTDNMKTASQLFRDLYKVPMKEAAFWLDHVMKYGGSYMRAASQKMPLYQFLILDVIAFIIVVIAAILVVVSFVIRTCLRSCRRPYVKSKTE